MGRKYSQITIEERCEIARLYAMDQTLRQIAATLDRAPSTITRELKRNRSKSTGLPEVIVMDNGPEFTSKAMLCWAQQRGVNLHFIDPGKPTQNAHIESFNGKFRDECLN